jgi:hypothetical protein
MVSERKVQWDIKLGVFVKTSSTTSHIFLRSGRLRPDLSNNEVKKEISLCFVMQGSYFRLCIPSGLFFKHLNILLINSQTNIFVGHTQ